MASRRKVRDGQRVAHLIAGALLVGYLYAAPVLGAQLGAGVRWVVLPVAVLSGLALWKWQRLRRLVGARKG